MLPTQQHPLYNFDFKPKFKHGVIHCEYEIKSSLPYNDKSKPYFHNILFPFKNVMLRKPFIWYKNKKEKNSIYHLWFYGFKLTSHSDWHVGVESKYENFMNKFLKNNPLQLILVLLITALELLVWGLNYILFKILKHNNFNNGNENFGFEYDSRKIIEKTIDSDGRKIYVKSKRESYVSFDKVLSSYITYDEKNNLYIEELTISYVRFEGLIGPVPSNEKMKLVVYPYYENQQKPKWFNDFENDWWNCLVFETLTEDRLKYIIAKDNSWRKLI